MSDLTPWIVAAIGWALGATGVSLSVYFGLRARKTAGKLDSLLRVMAVEGKVIDMGGGSTAKVAMLPSGKLGLNYTLAAGPGAYRIEVHPVTLRVSRPKEERSGQEENGKP